MAVTLTENKGPGLFRRIAGNGYRMVRNVRGKTAEWVSNDDAAVQAIIDAYTVQDAAADLCKQIEAHAKQLRDAAVSGVSPGEIAAWPIKAREAAAYLSSGNPAEAPFLDAEAEARGATLEEIANRVQANANRLTLLEAQIAGTAGRHKDAIRAFTDFPALLAYDWRTGWPDVPESPVQR